MKKKRIYLQLIILGLICVFASSCVLFAPKAPPPPPPPPKPVKAQPKPVDAKAQKYHYDQGLQHYSKENYQEAKESFQQAVDLGPNTALGIKAQENLKKVQKILKTLEEMNAK